MKEDKYAGMTVNERLYISRLLQEFDEAVQNKDKNKVIEILKAISLDDVSIEPILVSLGLN